jgi:hypothetical protein
MPDEKKEIQHNVFISWSGNRSKHVAEALREWLPMVLQVAKPFLSKKDIDKGSRWHIELANALETTKVGIVCLTPENPLAPWLLFEAGALSKTVDRGTVVCTYLLAGLQPSDVRPPLSEFQATKAEKDETQQMLQSINKAIGSPLAEHTLNGVFDALWPMLEAKLSALPEPETNVPPKRNLEDMISEVLDLSRTAAKSRESVEFMERYLPTLEVLMRVLEANVPPLVAQPVIPSGPQVVPIRQGPVGKTAEPSIRVNLSDSMQGFTAPSKPPKVNE